MKLFISWSGVLSHKIAKELQEWFPLVINQLKPFVSSENIKKGDRWIMDISSELEQSNFGIICLTKENLQEPWIMFEAGALSKNLNQSRVSCILFDGLKQSDVKSPLSLFQNTEFTYDDFKKLLHSINNSLGDNKINEALLTRTFDKWFPELEEKIRKIQEDYSPPAPPKQEGENALSEILRTTQYISNVVSRFNLKLPEGSLDFVRFSNEYELEYATKNNNHPVKVYINPIFDNDGIEKEVTITNRGLTVNPSPGPTGRGVLIEILFHSEHGIFWTTTFHFHKGDTYVTTDIANLSVEEEKLFQNETIWRD